MYYLLHASLINSAFRPVPQSCVVLTTNQRITGRAQLAPERNIRVVIKVLAPRLYLVYSIN